jgi:uncharacterized protein (TIGR03083 family)
MGLAVELRELGAAYDQTRTRIAGLVRDLDDERTSLRVPACPEWSVHDVVAHVTGNCADIIKGNLDGAATDGWTAAQVEARKERSMDEILTEWDEVGPQISAMLDDFPGRYGNQTVGDLAVHEHDLRGALEQPGARESDAIDIGLDFLVGFMLRTAATTSGLGPLEVRAGDRSWIVGTGEPPTGDPNSWLVAVGSDEAPPEPKWIAVGTVSAAPFEMFRAATGRRSADQIRGFDWTVDPEPFLPMFGFGPFTLRETDLVE